MRIFIQLSSFDTVISIIQTKLGLSILPNSDNEVAGDCDMNYFLSLSHFTKKKISILFYDSIACGEQYGQTNIKLSLLFICDVPISCRAHALAYTALTNNKYCSLGTRAIYRSNLYSGRKLYVPHCQTTLHIVLMCIWFYME